MFGYGSTERAFERRGLAGQQFGSILGYHHDVFASDAELARNVDTRLITECHSRFKPGLIPTHQVSPFVAIHPDAVPYSVSEVLVVRSKPRIGDHLARGSVNVFAGRTRTRRFTMSNTLSCLSVGFPKIVVRVMSDE